MIILLISTVAVHSRGFSSRRRIGRSMASSSAAVLSRGSQHRF